MTITGKMMNDASQSMQAKKLMEIEVEDISRNPLNTAPMNPDHLEALEELMKKNGVLEPVTVYKVSNNNYMLLGGERRWLIAKRLNIEMIPAVIMDKPLNEIDEKELIELLNVKRPDDHDVMKHKINRLAEIAEEKRDRGDRDMKGVRTRDWIATSLSGISSRTVQEYLTGKYSDDEFAEAPSKEKKPSVPTLMKLSKQIEKLRIQLEKLDLSELEIKYQDLNEFEYQAHELELVLRDCSVDIRECKDGFVHRNNQEHNRTVGDDEHQMTLDEVAEVA